MNKIKIAIAVMAAVMMLSTAAVAFAQGTEPPATPTPPAYGQTFWQTFAEKLGVTVDKLQGAFRDALKAVVAQMLQNGKLTQQQADNANSRIDKMPLDKPLGGPFLGGRGFMGRRGEFAFGQPALDAAAQKLGMTTQNLLTELRSGKTLADVAKEKNVNSDDLKTVIVNAIDTQIDQAVKDSKLTQTQADNIKAQVAKITLDQPFGKGLFGGGFFGKGPNNGWFHGNRPFGPRGNPTPQPSTPQS